LWLIGAPGRALLEAGDEILKYSARDILGQNHDTSDDATASDPALRGSGVRARAERAPSAPPISFTEAAPALISIGSPADPALLDPTYAYLSAYCNACLEPQVAQRLNVAIYELYANALRYGSPGGEVRLELHKTPSGARLTISNSAPIEQRQKLQLQIERVQRDPEAAFSAEMDRFTVGSGTPPMLGVVRVAHESGLTVGLQLQGDSVCVSTVCEA
jgi:hypothetical protein